LGDDAAATAVQLARQTAMENNPQGGLCGFELEWNMLDAQFHPLFTVGSGPSQQSFVDYLRKEGLSSWVVPFSQLEVFNWMIEWVTRPYYTPRLAVYESRLMEAFLINALHQVGRKFGERLYYWHGNLPSLLADYSSIPGSGTWQSAAIWSIVLTFTAGFSHCRYPYQPFPS
jgi:hypothetical protein